MEPAPRERRPGFLGESLDNTGELNGSTWRHVKFIDNVPDETMGEGNGRAFLIMSDVCKHCQHASCMDVCPTGAIIRTEFDTVYIQEDVCNGCRNCIAACPYDVIAIDEDEKVAQKCTLCYDRLQGGMEPACAKACPTDSIQFGPLDELRATAKKREAQLHAQGLKEANLYGADDEVYGGLNAFFLLMDKPEAYNLPNAANAVLPGRNNMSGYLGRARDGGAGRVRRPDRAPPAQPRRRPRRRSRSRHDARSRRRSTSPAIPSGPGTSWPTSSWRGSRAAATSSPRSCATGALRPTSRRRGSASTWPCRATLICPILLTLDLDKPLRFWHMLVNTSPGDFGLNFNSGTPMSVGVWALLVASVFALVSFVDALVRDGKLRNPLARRLAGLLEGTAGKVWDVAGAVVFLFIAGYTGVLLAVSNQPIWSDTWALGGLFLASGLSGSAALLLLLMRYRRDAAPSRGFLELGERLFAALELVLLACSCSR